LRVNVAKTISINKSPRIRICPDNVLLKIGGINRPEKAGGKRAVELAIDNVLKVFFRGYVFKDFAVIRREKKGELLSLEVIGGKVFSNLKTSREYKS